MNNRIMVKVGYSDRCLSFRTISRGAKSPQTFYISYDNLMPVLWGHTDSLIAKDIYSFAEFRRDANQDRLFIRFSWLTGNHPMLTGWMQEVALPISGFSTLLEEPSEAQWSCLSADTDGRSPTLYFASRKNLHDAVSNPIVHRKLVRFLRDNFSWLGAEQIVFHDDFTPFSFVFQERRAGGQIGCTGGLILHGQDDLNTASYSIHT